MRIFLTLILSTFLAVSYSQEVGILVLTQPVWPPGKAVVVTVEITKNSVSGFARFFQDLPQGFIAEPVHSAGADFYWENNQVNLVWVKLPDDEVLKVQYLVTADESLGGSFRMGGRFDYIINGKERRSVEFNPILIRLNRSAPVSGVPLLPRDSAIADKPLTGRDTTIVAKPVEMVIYRVQVAISSQRLSDYELEERIGCKLEQEVTILKSGNMFKYQTGSFNRYGEASAYLNSIKEQGVSDAFIVAFRGAEQISVDLAKTLEK
ncbi:MAG TPA: hypothetical protein VMW76_02410 [Bacteroidales bacterium]|nr:hypothetical protein [Bacteroidales bacterium]